MSESSSNFRSFCELLGIPATPQASDWFEASTPFNQTQLRTMTDALFWVPAQHILSDILPEMWADRIVELGLCRHLTGQTLETIRRGVTDPTSPGVYLREVFWRETALRTLDLGHYDHFVKGLLRSAETMSAAFLTLTEPSNGIGKLMVTIWPELDALRQHLPDHISTEHEQIETGPHAFPLIEHLGERTLARKLRGLEHASITIFQRDDALCNVAFDAEAKHVARLEELGMMPTVRAALLFLDFAKGGTKTQRKEWEAKGIDLSIHNEASARIARENEVFRRIPRLRACPLLAELACILVANHGLVGQTVRGETPLSVFTGLIHYLTTESTSLGTALGMTPVDAIDIVVDMLHVINVCDTAAVREGLFDDTLRFEFLAVESLIRRTAQLGLSSPEAIREELRRHDGFALDPNDPLTITHLRRWLFDRLTRLRRGRLIGGEPAEYTLYGVERMTDEEVRRVVELFRRASLWYMEVATSVLTPESQLKLLAGALFKAASNAPDDADFHVSFSSLLRDLDRQSEPASPYRIRLIETLLNHTSLSEILDSGFLPSKHALGSLQIDLGASHAVAVRFEATDEARALLTLLPLYERKSNAAFHATLKLLCDLYGLRKDEFDRISNEVAYLTHMNSARSDKERMLDFVPSKPQTIVEIGPGGGVILDLISDRFPDVDCVGIDISKMVVESLQKRREKEKRRWRVIEGDAFHLTDHFAPASVDAVVLCSLLHEIYSYIEYKLPDNTTKKFRLESVRDLIRAAFDVLKPGGRLIIRDGIMPADEPRTIEFIDPEGPEFFRLFQEQFEGRAIAGEWKDAMTVRTNAPDAMEFLYCYTWGPESFPYEVREQYGVLPYDEYCASILQWVAPNGKHISIPDASYLQDGYRQGLESKVILRDRNDQIVPLPDSNCLIIFEKIA